MSECKDPAIEIKVDGSDFVVSTVFCTHNSDCYQLNQPLDHWNQFIRIKVTLICCYTPPKGLSFSLWWLYRAVNHKVGFLKY